MTIRDDAARAATSWDGTQGRMGRRSHAGADPAAHGVDAELRPVPCSCGRPVTRDERCPCGACPVCCADVCQPEVIGGHSACGHCGTWEGRE